MNYQQRYRQRVQSAAKPKAVNDGKQWSSKDDRIIRENINLKDWQLAALLGRTVLAVSQHRQMMDIGKKFPEPKEFRRFARTDIAQITVQREDAIISVWCPADATDDAIAAAFGAKGWGQYFEAWRSNV